MEATERNQDALERLIDESSVREVLETIAEVCRLKADHIRENWQDAPLAKEWERRAKRIDRAASGIGV